MMQSILRIILLLVIANGSLWAETAEPEWQLSSPDGNTIEFPDQRDGPVVLVFWASWCPYCRALMPHLQTMLDEFADKNLRVYAINFRDDGDPQAYLRRHGLEFLSLANGGEVAKLYEIHGTPGLLIFDKRNQRILNIYDVMAEYNAKQIPTDGLSHTQIAAQKVPYWADKIRHTIAQLDD